MEARAKGIQIIGDMSCLFQRILHVPGHIQSFLPLMLLDIQSFRPALPSDCFLKMVNCGVIQRITGRSS